jgi:subtilase-type serine protease
MINTVNVTIRWILALLLLWTLAACRGSAQTSDDQTTDTGSPPSNSSILTRFFVESFGAFEETARNLIENDPRYRVQDRTWFFDANGNGLWDQDTEELYNTYPLYTSGVYYAHAAGLTGAGQIIAITDSGFFNNHEVFDGKTIHEDGVLPNEDHGTLVASVAVGNSSRMIGMAPGADLVLGSYGSFESLARATRLAQEYQAVAQNNSWGFVNTPLSQTSFNQIFSSEAGLDYLNSLQNYAEAGVVIFAVSNVTAETKSDLMPALPVLQPELESGWLAVINADAEIIDDDIVAAERISAGCLEAAAWCLAAEGSWFGATATAVNSYEFATGSSFAAPMVAGALAILAEAFPDMAPHDLRIRLLASADNTFIGFDATGEVELVDGFYHAISNEWGHGFLDVKAALLPIGTTTATLSDGTVYDVATPLAIEGGATGDAVTRALRGVNLIANDALQTQFSLAADDLVTKHKLISLSEMLTQNWMNDTGRSCCDINSYYPQAFIMNMGSKDATINLLLPADGQADASYGISLERHLQTDIGVFSATVGFGRDSGEILPQWQTNSESIIVSGGLELIAPLGGDLSLEVGVGFGRNVGETDSVAKSAQFNSANAAFVADGLFVAGDKLSLSVGLPVAVTGGTTNINLPVTTLGGVPQYADIEVDLAPANREIRFGVSYGLPISDQSEMILSLAQADNFGNVSGQKDIAAFFGFKTRF